MLARPREVGRAGEWNGGTRTFLCRRHSLQGLSDKPISAALFFLPHLPCPSLSRPRLLPRNLLFALTASCTGILHYEALAELTNDLGLSASSITVVMRLHPRSNSTSTFWSFWKTVYAGG